LDFFPHCVAVLHAPSYRRENAGALRINWPRIPLPAAAEKLLHSAGLGRELSALLDVELLVEGVSSGKIRAELKIVALSSREGVGSLDPEKGDLKVLAGWGPAAKATQ
jgi:hypothetical protein